MINGINYAIEPDLYRVKFHCTAPDWMLRNSINMQEEEIDLLMYEYGVNYLPFVKREYEVFCNKIVATPPNKRKRWDGIGLIELLGKEE